MMSRLYPARLLLDYSIQCDSMHPNRCGHELSFSYIRRLLVFKKATLVDVKRATIASQIESRHVKFFDNKEKSGRKSLLLETVLDGPIKLFIGRTINAPALPWLK